MEMSRTTCFELHDLFNLAERDYHYLESDQGRADPERQVLVRNTINSLLKCGDLLRLTKVFSSNELLEDINTEDLRYLLIPVMISDLTLEIIDKEARLTNLKAVKDCSLAFLLRCKELRLLPEECTKVLDKFLKSQEEQEQQERAPVQMRELKIALYKLEKKTKEKYKALTERISKSYHSLEGSVKENFEREHMIALLDVWINKVCFQLDSTQREIEILEKYSKFQAENGEEAATPPAKAVTLFPEPYAPMIKVFGTSHRPFKYTPEQWALVEHERGLHCSAEASESALSDDSNHSEEMDNRKAYGASDQAVYRQRKWDDFTDENPRGSGNLHNRS